MGYFSRSVLGYFSTSADSWLNMPRDGLALSPWQSLQARRNELTASERDERGTAVAICIAIGIVFPGLVVLCKLWAALLSALILATGWYLAYTRQPLPPAALGNAGSVPKAPGGRKRIWIPATIILAVLSGSGTSAPTSSSEVCSRIAPKRLQ